MDFDLVHALNGARIVTKAGLPVANLVISKVNQNYPLKGFFRNLAGVWESATWNIKGEFTNNIVDGPKNLKLQEFTQEWFPITIWPGVFEGRVIHVEKDGQTVEERHFRLYYEPLDQTWEGPFPFWETEEELKRIKVTHWAALAPTPKEMEEHKQLMALKVPIGETITDDHYAVFNGDLKPIGETTFRREIGRKCEAIDQVTIFRNPYKLPLPNNAPPRHIGFSESAGSNQYRQSRALSVVPTNPT